jgi:hypothetical protein
MGTMTREEAIELIQAEFTARKIHGPALNDSNQGGMSFGGKPVYFQYLPDKKTLHVFALIYRFRRSPRPGVIEGFHKEASAGTDTGGGTVEYQSENLGVYLGRSYSMRIAEPQFRDEIERLAKAAGRWSSEVIPVIAGKVSASN